MPALVKSVVDHVRREVFEPPADQFAVLNGMRGISAYLVICFHVALFSGNFPINDPKAALNWFHRSINGFWVGLDVFFVLSGFLIGRILMTSLKQTGSVEFWSFFTRRSMRIFPAFYLVLTLAVFWYLRYQVGQYEFFLMGGNWQRLRNSSWQNYTYTMNYLFSAGDPNPMSWGWSLCVEEHFYLVLPLLLTVMFRTRRRGLRPAWLWVCMLVPFVVRAIEYARTPDIVLLDGFYYRSHNRIDEVWYGVLVAYYYVYHYDAFARLARRLGSWIWIAGAALIASVWVFGGLQERGVFAVIFQFNLMALGAALVMVNGLFLDNRVTRFFAHRTWYPIARVSYGIYLLHGYVLFAVLKLFGFRNATAFGTWQFFALFVAVMAGSTLLAAVMFVSFESPLIELGRRWGRRFRKPRLAPAPERAAVAVGETG